MKIYIYAICKNEEKFVDRWVASMSEADGIFVLDTGSSDSTVERLEKYPSVKVKRDTVSPFRFDTARNLSLAEVPGDADICICTDLDEVFSPGWRAEFEKAALSGAKLFSYRYVWSYSADGEEETVFNIAKAHRRNGFIWKHPVHEVLFCTEGEAEETFVPGVKLSHYPDRTKSRGQYLPLLELSVAEDPEDDRNTHYLGREYMYAGKNELAVKTFIKHLSLKSAVWTEERCASMRYMAKCLERLGRDTEAEQWYLRACAEAPYCREPWMETALFYYRRKQWYSVIAFVKRALEITEQPESYITDLRYRRALPYDLLSLGFYYTGDKKNALAACDTALSFAPTDGRLIANRKYFE